MRFVNSFLFFFCFLTFTFAAARDVKNLKGNLKRHDYQNLKALKSNVKHKVNKIKKKKNLDNDHVSAEIEENEATETVGQKQDTVKKVINTREFQMPRVPLRPNPLGQRGSFSRIAYGTLHWTEIDESQAVELLKICLDSGVTTFDLADVYGMGVSTELFGKALKIVEDERGPVRHKIQLIAKWGIRIDPSYYVDTSESHMRFSADEFLRLAQTDYIDIFMLHNPDDDANYNEIARVANDLINEGKIKHFTMSNHKKYQFDLLKNAMDAYGMNIVTHEMEYSVLHPQNMEDGTIPYMDELKVPVLAWGPSGGNNMGGQLPKNLLFEVQQEREMRIVDTLNAYAARISDETTPEQMAVAWILAQKSSNLIPILGSVNPLRLQQQIDAITIRQDVKAVDALEGISANIYRK